MKNSPNTFNKKDEWMYQFWQDEFSDHDNYMLDGDEYNKIREIIRKEVTGSLLDVGCAAGGTYLYLGKKDYKGVDFCEKFIESNKKRFPEVEWEVQDARALSEPTDSWDCVLLYDSIDDLPEWQKALREALRVSKEKIIVIMWKDKEMDAKRDFLIKQGLWVKQFRKTKEELGLSEHYFIIGRKHGRTL